MNINDFILAGKLSGSGGGGGGGSSDFSTAEITIYNPLSISGVQILAPIIWEDDEYFEKYIRSEGMIIDGEESTVIHIPIPNPTAVYNTSYTVVTIKTLNDNYMFTNPTGNIEADGDYNIWVSGNGSVEIAPVD